MPETIADDSVGIVETQIAHFSEALVLECGKTLSQYDIAYETYGELNRDASNAILICHALSGDQHAAGYNSMDDKKPGWWESAIGPGKAIDTNRFVRPEITVEVHQQFPAETDNPESNQAFPDSFNPRFKTNNRPQ